MTTTAKLRPGTPADSAACGRICYDAFGAIASAHGFPSDFATPEVAVGLASMLLGHPRFYSVVAELDGTVVGSNFLDERCAVAGIGPITVTPDAWDRGIGRLLMQDVLGRAAERGAPGIRLVQTAYHNRSLALYTELGFDVHDQLACLQGPAICCSIPGYEVRRATSADLPSCEQLCRRIHGHDRTSEIRDALAQHSALVSQHDGRISGYTTGVAFFGHSVGETNEDLKALIGAADQFAGPGLLVPASNADLLRWCLTHRLRIVQVMTLMTVGLYNQPAGAYLPSVLY